MRRYLPKLAPVFFALLSLSLAACHKEDGDPSEAADLAPSGPSDLQQSVLCMNYCQEAKFHCADGGFPISWGGKTCAEVCATYRTDGRPGATKGNTVQCRMTHVDLAAQNPQLHCPHASPDGGGVCVD